MNKHILNFSEYINESYLGGSKQPLYHLTYSISKVIESDMLKLGVPAYGYDHKPKSISLTRSTMFSNDGSVNVRLTLDTDLLARDGYISEPFDELGFIDNKKKVKRIKHPTKQIQIPKRIAMHKIASLPQPDINGLEIEYEERIYKEISMLGKYIMRIEFSSVELLKDHLKIIKEYLIKYPHIEICIIADEIWKKPIPIDMTQFNTDTISEIPIKNDIRRSI
jgi:hypothetical protein